MPKTPNYDRLRDKIDTLTWPTAEGIEQWLKEHPDSFNALESHLDQAITILYQHGLITTDIMEFQLPDFVFGNNPPSSPAFEDQVAPLLDDVLLERVCLLSVSDHPDLEIHITWRPAGRPLALNKKMVQRYSLRDFLDCFADEYRRR